MKIIIDAMGGDYAPAAAVEGGLLAVRELGVKIAFVGVRGEVEKELARHTYTAGDIEIIHAPQVIGMLDPATSSIRSKKDSSISEGIRLLKEHSFDAFVSAGNTGAVVCAASVFLGMLPGVERPAIGLVIPTLRDFTFLIDVGANTDPKPKHLMHSALMARIYSQSVLGRSNPAIGLLNIGEEATKGTDFAKETYKMFSEHIENFIGNVEASEIFAGKSDCVICDGFVGNVVIKVSEGLMESAGKLIKREVKSSPLAMLGTLLMKSRLAHIRRYADYSEYGGAPLLGVNGIVMISHGRSSPKAIKNAIRAAMREVEHNVLAKLDETIQ